MQRMKLEPLALELAPVGAPKELEDEADEQPKEHPPDQPCSRLSPADLRSLFVDPLCPLHESASGMGAGELAEPRGRVSAISSARKVGRQNQTRAIADGCGCFRPEAA